MGAFFYVEQDVFSIIELPGRLSAAIFLFSGKNKKDFRSNPGYDGRFGVSDAVLSLQLNSFGARFARATQHQKLQSPLKQKNPKFER